jgi:hypothetical protein
MLIFKLIGCICLAFFIANSYAVKYIKLYLADKKIWYNKDRYLANEPAELYTRNIKPFDCPKCLSFWLSICVCYYNSLPLFECILLSMISYTVAKLYSK